MQKILMVVLIFCGITTFLYAQNSRWEHIDTTYYADLMVVRNLLFTQQYYHFGEKIARLRYSENQGKTWLPVQYQGNVAPDLTKIIHHPKYLLTSGYYFGAEIATQQPVIYRSYTNGRTWDSISLPKQFYSTISTNLGNTILAVNGMFVHNNNIYLVLTNAKQNSTYYRWEYYGGGLVIRSEDDGLSWDTVYIINKFIRFGKQQHIASTETTKMLIDIDNKLFTQSNNTKEWKEVTGVTPNMYYKSLSASKISFFALNNYYEFDDSINTDKLWRSNAEGKDWKLLLQEDDIWAYSVTDSHLVASTPQRGVVYSANQGETWVSLNDGTTSIGMSALGISSDGWVYGSGIIDGVGGIFRRRLPVISSIQGGTKTNKENLLYPNPCSNVLTIINTEDAQITGIELYSLLGENLFQKTISGAGFQQSITLDVTGVPVGVYVAQIKSTKGTKTEIVQIVR